MTITREAKRLKVSSIRATGDIEAIRKEKLTLEIGESFDATGGEPVDPIIVEAGTLVLLGGKHRFAAALNRGCKTIDAVVVTGSPEDVETFALVEQVKRRKSSDAEIARLLELQRPEPEQTFPEVVDESAEFPTADEHEALEKYAQEHVHHMPTEKRREFVDGNWKIDDSIEPLPPLAPKTKASAVLAVATATGKSPAAVRQAAYRHTKAKEQASESHAEAPCIDTFGVFVPDDVLHDAAAHQLLLRSISTTMRTIQASVTRFAKEHGNMLLRVNGPMHDAAFLADALAPESVCLWCKCTKHRKGCPGCRGRGWLTASELKAVTDPKLKARGESAGIYVNGNFVKVDEMVGKGG